MKNRGFTLVELLAVLVILAVIFVMVFPIVTNILDQSQETMEDAQISKILNSTYDYTLKNISLLPEYGNTNYITLNELKNKGLIDSDIKDPQTNEEFSNDLVISIKNVGSTYKNGEDNTIMQGNYLYKVEKEFMSTDTFKSNKPNIKFIGYSTNPVVLILDISEAYEDLEYVATSSENVDLTSLVVKNITQNSKNVDEVDTSTSGIYHINYSVVDKNGYSNESSVIVIVGDNEKPILTIPENVTIGTDIKYYDLMKGASCTDNSGICDISIEGNITYGQIGKYTIKYSASDPAGNTITETRVITVKSE